MSNQVATVERQETLNIEDLVKYLRIYNKEIDWAPHLQILKKRVLGSSTTWTEELKAELFKRISFTILYPLYDKYAVTDPPEKLLFICHKYHQIDTREWYKDLLNIYNKDKSYVGTRNQALSFGFVYPLQYNPRSRQALNWLMDRAESDSDFQEENRQEIQRKMENLVYTYGGAVICNVFEKQEYSKRIAALPNWRTGYFFEKLIYDIYTPEQILKIKLHDLDEIKRSNPKLIKQTKV